MKNFIFGAGVLATIGIALFTQSNFSLIERSRASNGVSSAVTTSGSFFSQFTNRAKTEEDFSRLVEENSQLKAQLLLMSKTSGESLVDGRKIIQAHVFSIYPFNDRSLVTINAGDKEGVKKGMAVLVNQSFFFGQIIQVDEHTSVVRTIFDPDWQLPLKLGNDHVDGLLVGGRAPQVTLIPKDGSVDAGATAYLASREFPYGLVVGEAHDIGPAQDPNFKEANLTFSYDIESISEVSILGQ